MQPLNTHEFNSPLISQLLHTFSSTFLKGVKIILCGTTARIIKTDTIAGFVVVSIT